MVHREHYGSPGIRLDYSREAILETPIQRLLHLQFSSSIHDIMVLIDLRTPRLRAAAVRLAVPVAQRLTTVTNTVLIRMFG